MKPNSPVQCKDIDVSVCCVYACASTCACACPVLCIIYYVTGFWKMVPNHNSHCHMNSVKIHSYYVCRIHR